MYYPLLVIFILMVVSPAAYYVLLFLAELEDFTTPVVLYRGSGHLLNALIYSGIVSVIGIYMYTTRRISHNVPNTAYRPPASIEGALLGILIGFTWFHFYHTYEKPITLYTVERFINVDDVHYNFCGYHYAIYKKEKYNKRVRYTVFAEQSFGCDAVAMKNGE